MHPRITALLACAAVACCAGTAHAQADARTGATTATPEGPVPDLGHMTLLLPKDLKWTGKAGESLRAKLYGDADQPGPYAVVYRWFPGAFSKPHFHDQARHIYVISGTWWVSASNVYDERTTYPLHAGSFATHIANTVHWDGARAGEKEPAMILITGMGPVKTIQVNENGQPK